MAKNSVLLIISGSIAATKSLDLIRLLKGRGIDVRAILTKGGEQFISRKSVAELCPVYTDLFSPDEETSMRHITLSRESDLLVVAPASADLIAKMANGFADDLASATLLANNKKLLVAPAMNTQMWNHPAVVRNMQQLARDGAIVIPPGDGMLACGEVGPGRMEEPAAILKHIIHQLNLTQALKGVKALITSGPTHEAIDPVRFIGNRSSGKQGHAIAAALAARGASVTLISGPVALADPGNVNVMRVTSAREMQAACDKALPADVAIFAAAVADWRPATEGKQKLKKHANTSAPEITLTENPDILKTISTHKKRPKLVIGFAAETENLLKNATEKRKSKGCDWIVANDVSGGKIFDGDDNKVSLITAKGQENWPAMSKEEVAEKLAERITQQLKRKIA